MQLNNEDVHKIDFCLPTNASETFALLLIQSKVKDGKDKNNKNVSINCHLKTINNKEILY